MTIPKIDFVYEARVERVVDGDTLTLTIDLGFDFMWKQNVRLSGFDTPEIYFVDIETREEGEKSKKFLEDLLVNPNIIIRSVDYERGMYGRVITECWRVEDGLNINEHMKQYMLENYGNEFYYKIV